MSDGKKKARKVLATLMRTLAEILITVISAVTVEAIIRLISGQRGGAARLETRRTVRSYFTLKGGFMSNTSRLIFRSIIREIVIALVIFMARKTWGGK